MIKMHTKIILREKQVVMTPQAKLRRINRERSVLVPVICPDFLAMVIKPNINYCFRCEGDYWDHARRDQRLSARAMQKSLSFQLISGLVGSLNTVKKLLGYVG